MVFGPCAFTYTVRSHSNTCGYTSNSILIWKPRLYLLIIFDLRENIFKLEFKAKYNTGLYKHLCLGYYLTFIKLIIRCSDLRKTLFIKY